MAEGKTNRAISQQLFMSERAVERHVTGIFTKLDLPVTDQDHRRVLAVLAYVKGYARAPILFRSVDDLGGAVSTTSITSYEEAVASHEWRVPERYNIAQDVCDKHPADKLAMIHEHFDGTVREVHWGELQELANRFANVLRAHGVEQGDRVAMLLPPTPETAAAFFGTYKSGAILLSMSVLYGDDGIRHRVSDSQAKVLVTNAANKDRVDPSLVEHILVLDDELLASGDATFERRRHARRGPGAALLHVGHDRAGQGHRARAPLPARARGVRLLPRRARRRALPRHGRVGVGGGHRSAARAVALRRGPARVSARGWLRSPQAAGLPLPP